MCNCGLFALHISNYINAIIGWFLPWSIVHGIIAIVVLGSLNSNDISSLHNNRQTPNNKEERRSNIHLFLPPFFFAFDTFPPSSQTPPTPRKKKRMCNCGLFALHISNYINAIIGWFLPWSIVHGIIAIVVLGSLNSNDISSFHRSNGTWTFCLIIASVFSLIWSVLWAVVWFLMFAAIFPIFLGIICIFAASSSLYLMLYR
eukprot:TRINITY_DN13155_c0_g1_i1.p1 TRINITY_DN13155_c0_g1~~TRINITY_DN13155_c0_g1_i1.p1  ORF type:complete len:218 (+),score=84.80 TRINITY_DN13155_c0_g1_i1:49-654(+)